MVSIVPIWSPTEVKLGKFMDAKEMRGKFEDLLQERLYEAKHLGAMKPLEDYPLFFQLVDEIAEHIYRLAPLLKLKKLRSDKKPSILVERSKEDIVKYYFEFKSAPVVSVKEWSLGLKNQFPQKILSEVLSRKFWYRANFSSVAHLAEPAKRVNENYLTESAAELSDAVSRQYAQIQLDISNGKRSRLQQ